ncbi:hypothetical protein KR51_00032440 [Rubidibacter lacunae KORDI 51-2]|uniref:DUF1868 domain-containing protein n=1 Tax=Rubidibacter lacunae KORDI 51-2 TaxID=582515 RepID=U5D6L3_9CHRO|nr:hypothetical protein [Rubidibacter lacunae]ERN40298.1 hypothetical protein KR51_00032440 [Rubidibacter lacunae KORDI 51-2]
MDEAYGTYVERAGRLTQKTVYHAQLDNIQESPKYERDERGYYHPAAFPGFSIVTPLAGEDVDNPKFYGQLQDAQIQLLRQVSEDLLVPVPPASLHFTLADLIWADAYREATAASQEFDEQIQACVAKSFAEFARQPGERGTLQWQVLGLMLRPRAIVAVLLPRDERSYERLLSLRRAIYQNEALLNLGVEQQYLFTAHVTLGYFGAIPPELDRVTLCELLAATNDRWLEAEPQVFDIKRAELRRFTDMEHFSRTEKFPTLEF